MPGLTDFNQYAIKSEKQIVDSHNLLLEALNSNFAYTLTQVTDPLPSIYLGYPGNVLAIDTGSVFVYKSITDLINVPAVLDKFLTGPNTLRLANSLSIGLLSTSGVTSFWSIFGMTPGGATVDSVKFQQTDSQGSVRAAHDVTEFSVIADTASITMPAGSYCSINALSVSGYTLPTTAPTAGMTLVAASSTSLVFGVPYQPLQFDGSWYSLTGNGALAFPGAASYPALNISFGAQKTYGMGMTAYSSGGGSLYFRVANQDVMEMVAPSPGNVAPHLKMTSAFVLPNASNINLNVNPTGSIWYDSSNENIVLISASGIRYINSQAITQSVNTQEAKDFILQPASTLSVDSGTEAKPALNVGAAGLISNSGALKIVVSGVSVASVSSAGIQSATAGALATAKLAMSSDVGLNSASKPTYTFQDAEGLGLYRSDVHAMAIAVKGLSVVEFTDKTVNLKGNNISNLATPVVEADAATKGYVDSRIPTGTTHGSLPIIAPGTSGKYVQSDAKYIDGQLEIGSPLKPAAFKLNSISGGAVTIKAPATNNQTVFELPSNYLNNGVLQTSNGKTSWVSIASITSNTIKSDGSVLLVQGLSAAVDTTPDKPLIGRSGTGVYAGTASGVKVGFSARGERLFEANVSKGALLGSSDVFNAPFIRLSNTLTSYTAMDSAGLPTYSFAGESNTGLGQTQSQTVSLMVIGTPRLSVGVGGVYFHSNKLQAVAEPVNASDAATKNYVDKAVKQKLEVSFRITSLPAGWSAGAALILSIYDSALIYQNAVASLVYESASDKTKVSVPSNFATNPNCQVHIGAVRLVKMAASSGIRQVAFASNTSILLNFNVSVGDIITVHL